MFMISLSIIIIIYREIFQKLLLEYTWNMYKWHGEYRLQTVYFVGLWLGHHLIYLIFGNGVNPIINNNFKSKLIIITNPINITLQLMVDNIVRYSLFSISVSWASSTFNLVHLLTCSHLYFYYYMNTLNVTTILKPLLLTWSACTHYTYHVLFRLTTVPTSS